MMRMVKTWKKIVLTGAAVFAGAFYPCEAATKFVAAGWDLEAQTPESILRSSDALVKAGIDGVALGFPHLVRRDGEKRNFAWGSMTAEIEYEDLKQHIPTMREFVRDGRLASSFVMTCWTPVVTPRLDWRDDAKWARVARNLAAAARLAKESGWKGLFCDNEDYGRRSQYMLAPGDLPYAQTRELARRRGAEVGRAVFAAYPDITLVFFWGLTLDMCYRSTPDPAAAMVAKTDLWPAFLDGLFDVMPPTVTFVDGNEHAYNFQLGPAHCYDSAAKDALIRLPVMLSPENRRKYRAQTQVSFGQYMNIFVNAKGGTPAERAANCRDSLAAAAAAADEYVWLWGEKCKWVDWPGFKPAYPYQKVTDATWEDELPGLAGYLRDIADPARATEQRLGRIRASGAPNLVAGSLAAWKKTTWKRPNDPGTFDAEDGEDGGRTLKMIGTRAGCYVMSCSARPGRRYLATCRLRTDGNAHAEIRWKTKGKWTKKGPIAVTQAPDADGWRLATVEVIAPEKIDTLVWIFDAKLADGQTASFKDVAVYAADDPVVPPSAEKVTVKR